jgi:hypothetical protein
MSAQPAPNFTLNHIKGHPVSLSDFRGRTVVLIFAGRDSAEQSRQISTTLRRTYGPDQLPLIQVLDLHALPKMLQGIARGQVEKAYQEVAQEVTTSLQATGRPMPPDMSQVVIILPDWDGKVTSSFGLSGVDKQAVAVAVDGNGYIRGYGAGAQGGEQVLNLFGQGA